MGDDVSAIIERARGGDRDAFGRLVKSYQRRVYMTAFRMMGNHHDASDVAQEAFIRAFRGLGRFDSRSDFFTWLYRIVINVSLNHLRMSRRKRRRTVSLEDTVLPEPLRQEAGDDPRKVLEFKRMMADTMEALEQLPDTQRATVVLVVGEGLPYREAAEILECSEGTVAWRMHEARKKLQQRLTSHLGRRDSKRNTD